MELKAPREIALLVAALVVVGRAVDGPSLWIVAALAVAATVAGMLHVLGEWRAWRVAPSLALPALTAFASIGFVHYLNDPWPVVAGLLLAAPASAALVEWVIGLELDALDGAFESESLLRGAVLFVGFLAFTAVGGLVPGAIGGNGESLSWPVFLAAVALDLAVGAAVGYRLVKLRGLSGRPAALDGGRYLAVAGLLGAAMCAVRAPRLVGPALLVVAIFAWSEFTARRAADAAATADAPPEPAAAAATDEAARDSTAPGSAGSPASNAEADGSTAPRPAA